MIRQRDNGGHADEDEDQAKPNAQTQVAAPTTWAGFVEKNICVCH